MFYGGFYCEGPGLPTMRRVNAAAALNNPRQMQQLVGFILDSGSVLTWAARLSNVFYRFIMRCRYRHNSWIDMNAWLMRRYFGNTDPLWLDELCYQWACEWVPVDLQSRFELYLKRCNKFYFQRYRNCDHIVEQFFKEDVAVRFMETPPAHNHNQQNGGLSDVSHLLRRHHRQHQPSPESPSLHPRYRLLRRFQQHVAEQGMMRDQPARDV